ncbi:MAG: hypothetical protein ACI3W7_07660 [Oscillospiraceae bacterium]
MKKIWYIVFIVLFFAFCLVPSVGLLVKGPGEPAANEAPAAMPRLKSYDGSLNVDYLTQLKDYVGKGFFGRLEGITGWDTIAAKVFHTSANSSVLIGPDGWLFFGAAAEEIAGSAQMSDREIWAAARSLYLMQEYAEGQGADFVFTVPCGKYTLYPDHAPDFVTVQEGSNRERLMAAMAEQGVHYADLYAAFTAVDEELYWKWDSHWTEKGAALGADTILASLGRTSDWYAGPFAEELSHTGDLYVMLFPTGTALETSYSWQPGFTFSYTSDFRTYDDMLITTENPDADGSLLLFRDSSGRSLYPYLAESFGSTYISRSNNYRLDWIGAQEADTVIVELAERTLPYLLSYPAIYPAPEREAGVLSGAVTAACAVTVEDVDGTLAGFQKLTGTLPETAVDSPVYLVVGDTVYEAIPNEGAFTAWLPSSVDAGGVQVYYFK